MVLSVLTISQLSEIAYNAAQGNHSCTSGISVYQPIQSDSAGGTHVYVAENFTYGNLEPSVCAGGTPTDGEGIMFDSFDGSQGGPNSPYTAQAVAANNILVANGRSGIEVFNNASGSSDASIYVKQNTSWGNLTDTHQSGLGCGDVAVKVSKHVQFSGNLISTRSATGCGGHPIYAVDVSQGDGSDSFAGNAVYGYNGNNLFYWNSGSFAWGSNQVGVYPNFANPVNPGAPQCGGAANVPGCMSSVIANFTPRTSSVQGFGYQRPSSGSVHDPLFPRWLCTANVPSGLITMGCS